MRRARGFLDLGFDLVDETADLVERVHDDAVERWARRVGWIEPLRKPAEIVADLQTAVSGVAATSVRWINGIVRFSVNGVAAVAEAGIARSSGSNDIAVTTPVSSDAAGTTSWLLDHLQSSLNGFWGDYLSRTNRRLDLGMTLRHHGQPLTAEPQALAEAFPEATGKICVFVHGLATTEWSWSLSSEEHYGDPDVTFGSRLRADLGFTPVYVRYNSGRLIAENGRALAALLTEVLKAYPVPLEEIALVGHSMGGLVVRSAAHSASETDEPWLAHLQHVACIASPHHGAPLEKAVSLLTAALSRVEAVGAQVPATILATRSPGIKDLAHSHTADDEWFGQTPEEIPADSRRVLAHVDGIGYHFLAATITPDPDHPVGKLFGDLLVRLPSASGEASEPARRIPFASGSVFPGMSHFDITNHPEVYSALHDLLATSPG